MSWHDSPPGSNLREREGQRGSALPRLVSEEGKRPYIDRRLLGVTGPRFKPLGQSNGRWHDLEIIVTPETVTARWDGQTFAKATPDLQKDINRDLITYPPPPGAPLRAGFLPAFRPRGGLGLFVFLGSASFRAVTVNPL